MNKTWAGDISEVSAEIETPLRKIIRKINWTGGAELEMVRDADGQLWLLEMNPRFPAWIHGATIAGLNLPAQLIEGATGIEPQVSPVISEEFTRVVLEIPVRPRFPLSPLPEPLGGGVGHSLKHPSGLLGFANRMHAMNFNGHNGDGNGNGKAVKNNLSNLPASFVEDISNVNFKQVQTPSFLFLEKTASELF